ncbi:PglZ domain-containing protein [Actinopolyspora saharensis]|uniref:PglZ domain-containing protein n=1 Tax=Actinopolyspora saharensis TaxID=995062 RepID=A0A1H0YI52_9ACTN|nr:PglZ domain-containing protein [Actinopolyspora saharensis]
MVGGVTAATERRTNASQAVVHALLDEALAKGYEGGVLGVQAEASWEGPESFTHAGRPVRVAVCPSTLAVWEALRERGGEGWLVVLTPRDATELGGGALTHLIWNRLRTPDPWQAVQQRFAAANLDPALYQHAEHRTVAAGLLAAMPQDGWPPAPGGVLTRDHALEAVVRAQLQLVERGVEIDVTAVLEWSLKPAAPSALADLRATVGDPLTDSVIDWLAGRCGLAAGPVATLLRQGRPFDLVPLGLIAGLLNDEGQAVARAVGHFEGAYRLGRTHSNVLNAWHADAFGLTTQMLAPETKRRVLDTAAARLSELDISELAETSDVLPAGLRARLAELAKQIRTVLPREDEVARTGESDTALDGPLITAELAELEAAWKRVTEHHLAGTDDTVRAFAAAVRLVRWLATDVTTRGGVSALVERQVTADAWVDAAVNDAMRGSAETELAGVLGSVLELVRLRRDRHDRAFGAALAADNDPDHLGVERVLPEVVIPLANQQPVLLLVIDGLSVAIATELVADAARTGWAEYAAPGQRGRAGALAVLPTLTEFSRYSLLSGQLGQGSEDAERRGFADLTKQRLRTSADAGGRAEVPLFHKKQLDTAPPGQALAPQIQTAIADTEQRRLVAAVLNTVDDTLHHTDPGGTDWSLQTIRHLAPLLEAARRAGRTVVITSDHGHVIERRDGQLRKHEATYGSRARATGDPVTDEEVQVSGPRVLTGDGTAVLAVNERVRYGPLNAGYHGGGSPAEVVVPLLVLHAGDVPGNAELTTIGTSEPTWWHPAPAEEPISAAAGTTPQQAPQPAAKRSRPAPAEGLFELEEPVEAESEQPESASPAPDATAAKLAKAVTSSKTFTQQRAIAGRVSVSDEKITALLTALLNAPDRRIPAQRAAGELGIAPNRLRGALPLIKRVLDVEGYVVLGYEQETADVVLDEAMLREQFGVRA